jgi:transcriptional regulator of heat shock response
MTDRSEEILLAAVREFIKNGSPVSSAELYEHYSFGIKPAMIRHELLSLTDAGFLEQPYHSAGRVPSDSGYRFFAEQILANTPTDPRTSMFEEMLNEGHWADLLKEFSKQLGLVGVLAGEKSNNVQKYGLEYLFEKLDADSRKVFSGVVKDVEDIEERLSHKRNAFGAEDFLNVFIGQSPITKSNCLSVMAADYDVGGEKVFFFAIGPKRMDYEKTAKVLKGLKKKSVNKNWTSLKTTSPQKHPQNKWSLKY